MTRPLAGLQWLANSAGISGLLIAIGYFVRFSQEGFLGVSINLETSAATFLLDGGRFLADLLVLIPGSIFSDVSTVLPLAMVLLSSTVVWQRRRRHFHVPTLLYILIALLASGTELVFHDLPVLPVSDLLITTVKPHEHMPKVPFIFRSRTEKLRDEIVCSRTCSSPEKADQYQGTWFTSSFLYTLAIFILIVPLVRQLWKRSGDQYSGAQISSRAAAVILLSLVGINILFVPLIYARLIRPTIFPEVLLWASKLPSDATSDPADADDSEPVVGSAPTATKDTSTAPPRIAHIDGFLLSYGDVLTIYNKDDRKVWLIPKTSLLALRIATTSDVLGSYFSELDDQ